MRIVPDADLLAGRRNQFGQSGQLVTSEGVKQVQKYFSPTIYSAFFRGLPPARVLRRAASWRKYSEPRFAVVLPPLLPRRAAALLVVVV
jgi:hypothetical protein